MITVVVVIHLLIAMAMIALILLQKTEGAAGGGLAVSANLSSMMQPRARANPLSRATVFLGVAFFVTSIGLALLSKQTGGPAPSIFVAPDTESAPRVNELRADPTAPPTGTPIPNLDGTPAPNLGGPVVPAVPQGGAPAVPSN